MIVRVSVENWMSFRERIDLSMVATRERQHGERVPRLENYRTRVLPVAALYGGNASGKTNLFRALDFARSLVVEGSRPDSPIPVEPFRLSSPKTERPSRFIFEILVENLLYEFSFAVTQTAVLEEKLVEISRGGEKVLYDRREGKPRFHPTLEKKSFLEFAFQGTRDNQLFLTNSVSQKGEFFKPVYDWFRYQLVLVAPDSRFGAFEQFFDEDHPLYATMNETISRLDTGISRLGGEEIPFDALPVPDPVRKKVQEEIKEGETVRLMSLSPIKERVTVTRKGGQLIAKKLVAFHRKEDGSEIRFDLSRESDGSQRVIDLLPAFLELSAPDSKCVYVIDEIDRSLHHQLIRTLLEGYLSRCTHSSRTQLLLTTHDLLLMDQNLLRRDEMWATERNSSGSSNLFSFSEYKDVRYDKDLRKSYLEGRLGGIPRVSLPGIAVSSEDSGMGEEGS